MERRCLWALPRGGRLRDDIDLANQQAPARTNDTLPFGGRVLRKNNRQRGEATG